MDYRDPIIREMAGDYLHEQLCHDLELLDVAGDPLDLEKVRRWRIDTNFLRKCD